MASRSAAGIFANTFVQRARSGSSASSPTRRDAVSRSVRSASSGPASTTSGARAIPIHCYHDRALLRHGTSFFVGSVRRAIIPPGAPTMVLLYGDRESWVLEIPKKTHRRLGVVYAMEW